jgi:hypothetical protein
MKREKREIKKKDNERISKTLIKILSVSLKKYL